MTEISLRPIDTWPGTLTKTHERKRTPFDATYTTTRELLHRELRALKATQVVLQIALREQDFRIDGEVRANARATEHPGVILAFDSAHGPLKYATDLFCTGYHGADNGTGWQENLRAIALGLEALRRVDRYGITKRGEQYTGWKALGSGLAMPPASDGFTSLEDAIAFLHEHTTAVDAGITWDYDRPDQVASAYRVAARRLHPDVGGDPELFKRLTEAKRMLNEAAR
jgi:hypothetical protein